MSAPGANALLSKNRVWENFSTAPLTAQENLFLTPDTSREIHSSAYDSASGVRIYLYTHGNPVNFTDPSGNVTLKETAIVSVIIGSLAGVTTFAITGCAKLSIGVGIAAAAVTFLAYPTLAAFAANTLATLGVSVSELGFVNLIVLSQANPINLAFRILAERTFQAAVAAYFYIISRPDAFIQIRDVVFDILDDESFWEAVENDYDQFIDWIRSEYKRRIADNRPDNPFDC